MDQRFTQADRRIDRFEASVDKRFDAVDKRFDKLEASINTRFDGVEQRFKAIDERLDVVEGKMDDVHTLMTQVRDYFEEQRRAGEDS
jgi:hypothetical protein